ncbi:nucleotidyltransferase domain-containing protein [Caulobacter sp. KR2-114]|uniref:nucleotidyltransferase domain-containing protein n=1 Tax=Caulobacter sp. KR2-114 TaxID=3400912 RepID=UPI003C109C4F
MSDARRWEGPPIEAWSMAWTPDEAAGALAGLAAPWAVAGGWALDLWLGRQTRPHGDLEITVPEGGFAEVRARLEGGLGLALFAIDEGQVIALPPGDAPPPGTHQTWVMDPATRGWRLDVFREPGDDETWVYRRTGQFSAPRAWASGRTATGIPYVAPQIVLLFKAKALRDKDQADFTLAAPRLAPDARAWLAQALRELHPGHAWIASLEG